MSILAKYRPAGYTLASLAVAIGGFLNGYDTGSIGAVASMPQFANSPDESTSPSTMGIMSPSLIGITVSMIMFAGALPSTLSAPPADKYGRVAVIAAGAALFMVGAVLQASAYGLPKFMVGRVFAGAGEGTYLGVMNVYICEIAPRSRRGTLGSMPQMLCALGICLGYFTCYGTVNVEGSMAWRAPFIVMAVLGAVMFGSCYFLSPSPRWLVLHGKRSEAIEAIEKLGIQQAEAEKDILRVREEDVTKMQTGFLHSLKAIFARENRSRTILALFILGMVQLCGIDGVLYYAPTLFAQAGLPEQTAGFLASGLSAILILAISIPAAMFADRWGRRTSVIVGGVLLSGTMFLVGSLYAANTVHRTGAGRWVVIISIFIFALTYSSTWAFVGKIYASEIQSPKTRAASMAVATCLGFFTNGLVALITPILLDASAYGAYFLFGGLSFGTLVVLALCMPETRGEALESIQEVFASPLRLHGISSVERLLRSVFSTLTTPKPSPPQSQSASADASVIELCAPTVVNS